MADNYRAHGETFASTNTGGIQTPIVHIDTVISDVTLDPTNLAIEGGNLAVIAGSKLALNPGTCVPVTFGAAHAETAAAVNASIIEVSATAPCHLFINDTPVATANSTYLPANVVVRYACTSSNKVSVIQHTTGGGILYITPGV
jgi:glutamine amidotransferase-like uncharacterized protein